MVISPVLKAVLGSAAAGGIFLLDALRRLQFNNLHVVDGHACMAVVRKAILAGDVQKAAWILKAGRGSVLVESGIRLLSQEVLVGGKNAVDAVAQACAERANELLHVVRRRDISGVARDIIANGIPLSMLYMKSARQSPAAQAVVLLTLAVLGAARIALALTEENTKLELQAVPNHLRDLADLINTRVVPAN